MVRSRIARCDINEATGLVADRTAAPEDVDDAMKLETN
jgi:3-hydroxyacyl-CoA dehydrogenase